MRYFKCLRFFAFILSMAPPPSGAAELPRLLAPIPFHECSHHSPQRELKVGMTVLGELGIELKTVTLYGTCESYVVFLAEDGSLYRKGPNGQDCFAGPSAEEFLHPGDKAYDEEFQSLYQQILRVREGSACLEPKPELDDLLSFLERFQREPWAKSPSSAFLFK